MSAREAWSSFGLVGLLVGIVSAYFAYIAWPAPILLLVISLAIGRVAALSGSLVGIGSGALLLLYVGSACPPATTCTHDPSFSVILAIAVTAVVSGVVLTPVLMGKNT